VQENERLSNLRVQYSIARRDWTYGELFCNTVLVTVTCFIPTIFLWYMFMHEGSGLENFVLSNYFVFVVLMIICGSLLLTFTTEDSISGMVAQRYNVISYLSILLIIGVAFYTSCFIACGAIAREKIGKSNTTYIVIFASLSPLISSMILISPLVVKVNAIDLGFVPLDANFLDGGYNLFWSTLCLNRMKRETAYCFQTLFHYLFVGLGIFLGLYSVIWHINKSDYSPKHTYELVGALITSLFLFAFFVAGLLNLKYANRSSKRVRLYFEFLGLYYYLVMMIYVSCVAGDIIMDF